LRYLLIQDWDLDDDGKPETLRLLYGAPANWFRDGAVLKVERAPTVFGELSLRVESHLSRGEVLAAIDPPPRRPAKTLLRLPLPPGWRVVSATAGGQELHLGPAGAVELPEAKNRFAVRFAVELAKK